MNPRERYQSLLDFYAAEHGVPAELLRAQMLTESNADPTARSPVGAEGLFQAMPGTFVEVMGTGHDPFNPETSIEFGVRYMARLLTYYHGTETLAVAAYNYGLRHVDHLLSTFGEQWRQHLPTETRDYLARVSASLGRALT